MTICDGIRAHTPGPWVSSPYIGPDDSWFITADGNKICGGGAPGINEANANLIAAAPDLLDACKRASEILRGRGSPGWGVAKDILNTAIAKAEGR